MRTGVRARRARAHTRATMTPSALDDLLPALKCASLRLLDARITRQQHRDIVLELAERGFGAATYLIWRERPANSGRMVCLCARLPRRSATLAEQRLLERRFRRIWGRSNPCHLLGRASRRMQLAVAAGPVLLAPFTLNGRAWGALLVVESWEDTAKTHDLAALARFTSAVSLQVARIDAQDRSRDLNSASVDRRSLAPATRHRAPRCR